MHNRFPSFLSFQCQSLSLRNAKRCKSVPVFIAGPGSIRRWPAIVQAGEERFFKEVAE